MDVRRLTQMLLAVLSLGVGLAACGSDSSSSSEESTGKAPATTEANAEELTGTPIKTMTITSIDSPVNNYKNIGESARIYGEWINANGGIEGHPLEIDVCDDKGQPANAAACARKAVSEEMVAVVGSFSFFGENIVPTLENGGVADFGFCCGLTGEEYTSPIAFQMGSQPIYAAGEVMRAVEDGCKNINAVIQEGTEAVLPVLENAAKAYDLTFGETVVLPGESQDYSAEVAKATGNGADCIVMFVAETVQTLWNKNYVQSGGTARLYGLQGNLDKVSLEGLDNALDGSVIVGMLPDITNPVWDEYRQALEDYEADESLDFNSLGGLGTWAAYSGFTTLVEDVGADKLDAKTFLSQANKTTALDTGGMYPTIDFTKEWKENSPFARVFNRNAIFQTVENGKVVPLTTEFQDVGNLSLGKLPE